MKNKLKGMLVGLLVGLIFSGTVLASVSVIKKELHYNNIKITLDGNEVKPTGADGSYVEPFIIDGVTYLPVRGIANALNLGVDWDGNTNTVILSTENSFDDKSSDVDDLEELLYDSESFERLKDFIIKNSSDVNRFDNSIMYDLFYDLEDFSLLIDYTLMDLGGKTYESIGISFSDESLSKSKNTLTIVLDGDGSVVFLFTVKENNYIEKEYKVFGKFYNEGYLITENENPEPVKTILLRDLYVAMSCADHMFNHYTGFTFKDYGMIYDTQMQ